MLIEYGVESLCGNTYTPGCTMYTNAVSLGFRLTTPAVVYCQLFTWQYYIQEHFEFITYYTSSHESNTYAC